MNLHPMDLQSDMLPTALKSPAIQRTAHLVWNLGSVSVNQVLTDLYTTVVPPQISPAWPENN